MFQTILKNASGAARYYGFLPPYGRELADGAEISVPAGVLAGSSVSDRRRQAALQKAINDGHITVKESPAVVLFDTTAQASRVVAIDNNTYGSVTPANFIGGVLLPFVTPAAVAGTTAGGTYQVVAGSAPTYGAPTAWAILSVTGGAATGISINSTTGLLTWAATTPVAGTYTITVRATNARGSDTGDIVLTIS
jgi:hypothetical protein